MSRANWPNWANWLNQANCLVEQSGWVKRGRVELTGWVGVTGWVVCSVRHALFMLGLKLKTQLMTSCDNFLRYLTQTHILDKKPTHGEHTLLVRGSSIEWLSKECKIYHCKPTFREVTSHHPTNLWFTKSMTDSHNVTSKTLINHKMTAVTLQSTVQWWMQVNNATEAVTSCTHSNHCGL